jgi:hypothetical protein
MFDALLSADFPCRIMVTFVVAETAVEKEESLLCYHPLRFGSAPLLFTGAAMSDILDSPTYLQRPSRNPQPRWNRVASSRSETQPGRGGGNKNDEKRHFRVISVYFSLCRPVGKRLRRFPLANSQLPIAPTLLACSVEGQQPLHLFSAFILHPSSQLPNFS